MSAQHLSLLVFSTLLAFALGNPDAPALQKEAKEAKVVVAVEGMVYCQGCQQVGTWSLAGAKPLPSAKVGVACKDHKNRIRFYKAVQTDNEGYFYTTLTGSPSKSYFLDNPTEACTVRLLSSPDPKCNLLTNTNYGINGSPLHHEKRVSGKGYEVVVYAAGPVAFRPAYCPGNFSKY